MVCLFESFVAGPVRADETRVPTDLPLAHFDMDHESYDRFSWIGVDLESGESGALVRLLTADEPFDTVLVSLQGARVGESLGRRLVPWTAARFSYMRRSSQGAVERLDSIVANQ